MGWMPNTSVEPRKFESQIGVLGSVTGGRLCGGSNLRVVTQFTPGVLT